MKKRKYNYKLKDNGKNATGRPRFELDETKINIIKQGAAMGLTLDQIGILLNCNKKTVQRKINEDEQVKSLYKEGQLNAIQMAGNTLFSLIKQGNLGATIFYLKCRANWKETQVIENVNEDIEITLNMDNNIDKG